ncbi:MAG: hypothetical protein H6617_07835 [Bdellovibrionaceae bacterium]|nr:hypothetical protein [Bdellovibrionales bacterium]MCB9254576.1 hypothetical protein [Pseudobdellovibrionaceae bacterium]
MHKRFLIGISALFLFSGCPITFTSGKDLLVDDGDFSGTWELTNVRSVLGGFTDRCDDLVFTISQSETEIVIDAREFRCASGAYFPSLPLITLDRSGSKLTSDGKPAGVLLTGSIIITWKLGTDLTVNLEISPGTRTMRYEEKFRAWQLSADAAKL